jgi:hypothetical protein
MHGTFMPSKLALERSFVFDTSAHLPFPPAAIPTCLLAAIDVTLLFADPRIVGDDAASLSAVVLSPAGR